PPLTPRQVPLQSPGRRARPGLSADHLLVYALPGGDHLDAVAQSVEGMRAQLCAVICEPCVDGGPQAGVQSRPVADRTAGLRGGRPAVVRPEPDHGGEDLVLLRLLALDGPEL